MTPGWAYRLVFLAARSLSGLHRVRADRSPHALLPLSIPDPGAPSLLGPGPSAARAFASSQADSEVQIRAIIADLAARQQRLGDYIDRCLDNDAATPTEIARLLGLHAQTASRLGRLLRDQQALGGEGGSDLAEAIQRALDELSGDLGVEL